MFARLSARCHRALSTGISVMLLVQHRACSHARCVAAIYKDPNFPLTADGRVHHLDVKRGEGEHLRNMFSY